MACNFRRAIVSEVKKKLVNCDMNNSILKFNKISKDVELHLLLPKTDKFEHKDIRIPDVNVERKPQSIIFTLNSSKFISDVLNCISTEPQHFWKKSDLFDNLGCQKVLIEFSSPNIAKPFHMGHLRSTIIGNFLSNLQSALGHQVVRINYLGDWGTQFGLLNVGLELGNISDSDIAANPIQALFEAYVAANKLAETDSSINDRARKIFKQLEDGSFSEIERWEKFRGYTVKELETTYERLGIRFDEYQWESMFGARDIVPILDRLREKGVLILTSEGHQVAKIGANRKVVLVKSDGTTLYLTRDVAAALYRYECHKFDRLLYVVDNSQTDHFIALRSLLNGLGHSWTDEGIQHIKFGRIQGMSTRKGQVVFLRDILDEARDRVAIRQQESATTKSDLADETSDILAVSAVVVNDLKQRRQRDYQFDWDTALQMHGDGGLRLQYTHCRLCSLEEKSEFSPATECQPEALTEPEVLALVTEIAKFDHVLKRSYNELEACILVNYLFSLSNSVNQAFKKLQVKDQPKDLASQRLLLFQSARRVLNTGMSVLGLKPLTKM